MSAFEESPRVPGGVDREGATRVSLAQALTRVYGAEELGTAF